MPCRDYEDDRTSSSSREIEQLRKQNDKLARIACNAMRVAENLISKAAGVPVDELTQAMFAREFVKVGIKSGHRAEVFAWWDKHKMADALQADAAKIKAGHAVLKKLTKEEREALRAIGVNIKEPKPQ